jgi:hypothetical protein
MKDGAVFVEESRSWVDIGRQKLSWDVARLCNVP